MNVLRSLLDNERTINIFLKHIQAFTDRHDLSHEEKGTYDEVLYQVVGDIICKRPLNKILTDLRHDRMLKNHRRYDEINKKIQEHDEFLVNPFEVVEGISQCGKCGGKRAYSYTKQCRSADEPSSVFYQCVNSKCKNKWVYSG
jgi:DNA-directed RNA polymerase subunit M/transcription elongation factor TFIIS